MKKKLFKNTLSVFIAGVILLETLVTGSATAVNNVVASNETSNPEAVDSNLDGVDTSQDEIASPYSDGETYIIGELEEKRTANEKVFIQNDGSFIYAMYDQAIHYQDENGSWEDIDNTLIENEDGSGYINKENDFNVEFADSATSDDVVKVSGDNFSLSWKLLNSSDQKSTDKQKKKKSVANVKALKSKGKQNNKPSNKNDEFLNVEKNDSSVIYDDVYEDVSFEYIVQGNTLKENIIVNNKLKDYEFSFGISTPDLKLVLNKDNTITGYSSDGVERVHMPAPFMYDSNNRYSNDVTFKLSKSKSSDYDYVLAVDADKKFINSSDTVFPVVIDPLVTTPVTSGVEGNYVRENAPNETPNVGHLWIGKNNSSNHVQGYLKFDLSGLPLSKSDVVVDAQFNVYQHKSTGSSSTDVPIYLYRITEDWAKKSITWNNKPAHNSSVIDYTIIKTGFVGWLSYDVTELVRGWYTGSYENYGFVLKTDTLNSFIDSQIVGPNDIIYTDSAKPVIAIQYRNNKGLENYWSYTPIGAGGAGTANINDFSGNLVLTNTVLADTGNRLPLSLTHVYNGYLAGSLFGSAHSSSLFAAKHFTSTIVGSGWQLNVQEHIKTVSNSELLGKKYEKVYVDGDGTEHYYYKNYTGSPVTVYLDEDGLGLTLTYIQQSSGNYYELYDDKGNKKTFNADGYLTKVADANGNSIDITYNSNKQITSISDGANRVTTFAYTDTYYLKSITDSSGRVTSYNYSGTNLTRINYPDGTYAQYTYTNNLLTSTTDSSGRKLSFTYSNDAAKRVTKIIESNVSSTEVVGQTLGISYDQLDLNTTYTSSGKDDVYGNSDDLKTTYIFDNLGRIISSYTTDSTGTEIYGAGHSEYTNKAASTSKSANKVKQSASTGGISPNLLKSNQLESTSNWTLGYWGVDNTTKSGGLVTEKYIGKYGIKVSSTSAVAGSRIGYYQGVQLYSSGKYHLSGYIKTVSLSGTGAFLQIRDEAGAIVSTSEYVIGTTPTDINQGWKKVTLSADIPKSGKYFVVFGTYQSSGTAYFDHLQLEESLTVSNINMLENSHFDDGINNWTVNGSTSANTGITRNAIVLVGKATATSYLKQTINIDKTENQTYVLSGWAKSNSVSLKKDSKRTFGLKAILNYADGTSSNPIMGSFSDGTDAWQYLSVPIVVTNTKKLSSIDVYLDYSYNKNSARFDNISLTRELSQTYNYDSNGKVISTSDYADQKSTFTYTNSDLTKVVNPTGKNYEYTYDSKHNLTSGTNESGVKYTFGYDSFGNVSTTKVNNKNSTSNIDTLYSRLNYSNGNYLANVIDNRGNVTYFNRDAKKGTLTNTTDPNGNRTAYTYNANNDLMTSVFLDEDKDGVLDTTEKSVKYAYDTNNRLSTITHNGFNYGFAYDVFDNITSVKAGTSTLVTNTYNGKNGKLNKVTYGNGAYKNYIYDALERISEIKYNGTTKFKWEFDSNGNVSKHTDLENSRTYDYEYDSLGRLVRSREYNGSTNYLSTETKYDQYNRISKQSYKYGSETAKNYTYSYTSDNLINKVTLPTSDSLQTSYDSLNRVKSKSIFKDGVTAPIFVETYSYLAGSKTGIDSDDTYKATTTLVSSVSGNKGMPTYYTYDKNGNILTIADPLGIKVKYTYDSLNQLTREDNAYANKTYLYYYNNGGNITSTVEFAFTTADTLGSPLKGTGYTYGDTNWKDKLTSYAGTAISYDTIGNPTNWRGASSVTWKNGREMATFGTHSYKYNSDGIRTQKVIGNGAATTNYTLSGSKVIREQTGTAITYYLYDQNGNVIGMTKGNDTYYYQKNIQNDVIRILDGNGVVVVEYAYDAWGNAISTTGTLATTIGWSNPFRYRSYYFDNETGLYYLNSRYYDPQVKRFLNADSYVSTGQGILGHNMFAYCGNNPVLNLDPSGRLFDNFWEDLGKGIERSFKALLLLPEMMYAAVDCVEGSVGAGTGIGGAVDFDISGVEVSAGAGYYATDNLVIDGMDYDFTSEFFAGGSLSVMGIGVSAGDQRSHSYLDKNCTCDFMKDPIISKAKNCPAAQQKPIVSDLTVGVGVEAFFILGVKANIGINLTEYSNKLLDIHHRVMEWD